MSLTSFDLVHTAGRSIAHVPRGSGESAAESIGLWLSGGLQDELEAGSQVYLLDEHPMCTAKMILKNERRCEKLLHATDERS